jgi:hypothetical protein
MKSVILAAVFLLAGFALGTFFRPATVRAADPAGIGREEVVLLKEVGRIHKVHVGKDEASTIVWAPRKVVWRIKIGMTSVI